ncbi:MAG: transcriptional regulator/antitoxin, MazE [Pseudomonadota bacterium]|jgi:antitoxin ChpS
MEIVLRRYGNSTVAVLPPSVLKALGLSAGQEMTLGTTEEGCIVLAPKKKFVLADLIAQCDTKAPPPKDLGLWDTTPALGQEVW